MIILNNQDINKIRNEIIKIKKEKPNEVIAVYSQDDEFNRKALEIKKLDILILNEELNKKDYLKQRNSGLNEILAKIAKKNNISLAIDIQNLMKKSKKEKAIAFSRLIQNITICKRTKTNLIFLEDERKEFNSLLLSLGASTQQVKNSVNKVFK